MKGREHVRRRHTLAVGVALVLGVTACGSGKDAATSAPRTTPSATAAAVAGGPASTGPSAREWLADLEPAGAALYVTSHSCPGQVRAGICTVESARGRLPGALKAFPLTLWRYDGERWEDLGRPGVFSYSDMIALPGGLLLVPRSYTEAADLQIAGPLRVSLDEGRTWQDWQIPQQRRRCRTDYSGPGSGPCSIAVAGDYVFVTSNFGWTRRNIRSGGWEDLALPKRAPMYDFDGGGYGLLALEDGTLIATATNPGSDGPNGFFRVSKDFGSTWSAPHDNPGERSEVSAVDGSALYALCWKVITASSSRSCGWYRTTDLEHWRKATAAEEARLNDGSPVPCRRDERNEPESRRLTKHPVRVGALAYGISAWAYVNGREATSKELPRIEGPHRIRHVLERSADSCLTWEPVRTGTGQ